MTGKKPANQPENARDKNPTQPEKPAISITFRPERPGLEKFMGRLEAEVMQIVWANGPMTVKRALYFINRKNKYAYTTIMTIMVRLHEKGYLSRNKEGASYVYSPITDERGFLKLAVAAVIAGLMNEYRTITANLFHKVRKASKKAAD
ncbi:MAG: CopY family transcriptional regulator [candidate division Zixibacteria bacterium HGW-Zixibacteria-1]|nr:MAG: CopY family transcriptional regulator [candidate division Zixibacteria bacterium HGW-Zixibacteria-1]